jgi:hypothetical protein
MRSKPQTFRSMLGSTLSNLWLPLTPRSSPRLASPRLIPGTFDTSLAITGQTGILTGSVLQAEVIATATADHSVDEVWVDRPIVVAGSISAGVGFTIYATARDGGRAYGLYTVHWKWI